MPRLDRRWWAWIVACGLVLGLAMAGAHGRSMAERSPEGWTRTQAAVPFRRADLMGELPEGQGAWSLDHFMGFIAKPALSVGETLTIEAQLPPGGELQIFPAARWTQPRPGQSQVSSTRMTVPYGGALVLRRSRGGLATGRRIDRDGEARLSCTGSLGIPEDAPFILQLTGTSGGFEATLGGETLRCSDRGGGDQLALRSGLQRVRILGLARGEDSQIPGGSGASVLWVLLGMASILALALLEVRAGADPRKVALTTTPLLICGLTLGIDGRAVVEQLRAPGLSPENVGLWVGLAPCLVLKLLHLGARLSAQDRAMGLAGPAAIGGLTALAIALSQPYHWGATVYLGVAALLFGGVVWANVRTVRFYNLLSLVGMLATLGMAEYGVRFTAAGRAWSPTGAMEMDRSLGWTNTAVRDFQQLDAAEHTEYPIEGFPVAFPQVKQKQRIACFGGSSTGGAYQNDDLDDFYPARLQDLLGVRAEVLNQGVGGWTTFHIQTYLERSAASLDPDILTLYVGHNDLLTRSRLPYRDLYARWQSGRLSNAVPLASIRLYQGLRYLIQSMADMDQRVAVPLDHARENIEAMVTLAQERGARVLLIPEAIHPDPGALVAYSEMMAQLAADHENAVWFDGSTLLLEQGAGMFIDDCHLTDAGHRTLGRAIGVELRRLGWVQ
jgi:lysophospholipase L1-like esterase